ncbi:MAG: PaaI family thioesterase [Deltaproteobacteria bacterium]|nr:MAG: PaaI family thioesterase [Deltaproteobacteria bacterium]
MAEAISEIWEEAPRGVAGDVRILALDGLTRMRAAVAGRMAAPPINRLTGLMPIEAHPGSATFRVPATPWLATPAGFFGAGSMALAADAALASAIMTTQAAGWTLTTSDLSLNFLRPVCVRSGAIVARARIMYARRSLGLAEALVEDGHGRVLGHATTRCFLLDTGVRDGGAGATDAQPLATGAEELSADPYLRPVRGAAVPDAVWNERSGLEVIQGILSGELPAPPVSRLFGLRLVGAEAGRMQTEFPATGWLAGPGGAAYGGALAHHVDLALSLAVQTTLPPATVYSPLDLKVDFLRPIVPDGSTVHIDARVLHSGRSLAVASAEAFTAEGKRAVVAMGSMLIVRGRTWSLDRPVVPEDEAATGFAEDRDG